MNFSYGIIVMVGILVGISIGFIAMDPNDVIKPRITVTEEKSTSCPTQSNPVCGVDGITYENQCNLDAANVKLDHSGKCISQDSLPMTATVLIPVGSSALGCEETLECYLPFEINVAIGATVSWNNIDSFIHTVTSGTVTGGTDGKFDSNILMANDIFEHTFTESGTFDYYCVVHPWMTGVVNVN